MPADDAFDLAAARLRADAAELAASLEVLAGKLEQALPGQVRVGRAGKFWGRGKSGKMIEVRLGGVLYRLQAVGGRLECVREREVGGVSIKREQLDVSSWLRALVDDVALASEDSTRARTELERLLR
jgi:hypothetical protein